MSEAAKEEGLGVSPQNASETCGLHPDSTADKLDETDDAGCEETKTPDAETDDSSLPLGLEERSGDEMSDDVEEEDFSHPIDLEELSDDDDDDDVPLALLHRLTKDKVGKRDVTKVNASGSKKSPKKTPANKKGKSGANGVVRTFPPLRSFPSIRTFPSLVHVAHDLKSQMDTASMKVLFSSMRMQQHMSDKLCIEAFSQEPPTIPKCLQAQMSGGTRAHSSAKPPPVPPGAARGFVSYYATENTDDVDKKEPSAVGIQQNHMTYEVPMPQSPKYN